MKKYFIMLLSLAILQACSETNEKTQLPEAEKDAQAYNLQEALHLFTLADFYQNNAVLEAVVDSLYEQLSSIERVGQMIMVSYGEEPKKELAEIRELVADQAIGGILFLYKHANPQKEIARFNRINEKDANIPLFFSIDGEPALIGSRFQELPAFLQQRGKAMKSEETTRELSTNLTAFLMEQGFNYNLAPVCDLNMKKGVVSTRSFGSDASTVIPLAQTFIKETQDQGMIATAKHFPGHGNVRGDSHDSLVVIRGEMIELPVFQAMVDKQVLSVLMGHIRVSANDTYDTKGLPSSLSPEIVTHCLREKMGFEGLIITDAMDMGAVQQIDQADLLAAKAGNDIILMPQDPVLLRQQILDEMDRDAHFQEQVTASVKRILRIKVCLGLFGQDRELEVM